MKPYRVLILPGWQNSGPGHWQSRWRSRYGYPWVEQHDWMQPRRGDWITRLEDVLLGSDEPAVLVAHSLGCLLVAAWAAHTRHSTRVRAALLVAPGDVESEPLRPLLPTWAPIVRRPLPFAAVVVASRDDPYCRYERAQTLAADWGARWVDAGAAGHINADSGLGDWDAGHALLSGLVNQDVQIHPAIS